MSLYVLHFRVFREPKFGLVSTEHSRALEWITVSGKDNLQPRRSDSSASVSEGAAITMSSSGDSSIVYSEKLWVPWWFWVLGAVAVFVCTAQIGFNRSPIWLVVGGIICLAVGVWVLLTMSKTTVSVEVDSTGERWLHAGTAVLPASVVAKSLVVPKSAQRNALGRQLDPAAFLVTHTWIPTMVLLVLDDPDDPTPYWLVSTRRPEALLDSLFDR